MNQPPDQGPGPSPAPGGPTPAGGQPTEEEMHAALDAQMREIRVEDLLLQSIASLINLSARRIAKEDERDLGQAQLGIDAVRAVVDLLPAEPAAQVRNALSELQVLYAQAAGGPSPSEPDGGEGGGPGAPGGASGPQGGSGGPTPTPPPRPQGPSPQRGEAPPRLWTPGSAS